MKPRNYVQLAMIKARKSSLVHTKSNKAKRRMENVQCTKMMTLGE